MIPSRINPIDHPVCVAAPERMAQSNWDEHVPFAMWLTSVLTPRVLVELGTFGGTSYCGFCQAIKTLGLATRAYAVDSWNGDPHNGSYGPEVLADLRAHHDARYASFSSLLEMTFDEAAPRFADKEIDLLHIDGYHRYEVVRHDFETWRDKLSDRAVVLFHDVGERIADFGVFQLWEELAAQYPNFTFRHQHGLGVLAVGRDVPDEIRVLTSLGGEEAERLRILFRKLGRRARLDTELRRFHAGGDSIRQSLRKRASDPLDREDLLAELRKELEQKRTIITGMFSELTLLEDAKAAQVRMANELEQQRARIAQYEFDFAELQSSRAWRLLQLLSGLRGLIASRRLRRRPAESWLSPPAESPVSEEPAAAIPEHVGTEGGSGEPHGRTGCPGPSWQPTGTPVFLLVSHKGGGGTERHVRELAAELRLEGVRPVLVRPSGDGSLLWEERDESWQVSWSQDTAPTRRPIDDLLRQISPAHAHIHHVMGLPGDLLDWLSESGISYDWTIHDYFAICPRAHLNRADGSYCGEPEPDGCNRCLSRLGDYNGIPVVESITTWRDRFGRYLLNARRVFAPSEDVRRRFRQYFPELPVLLRPHFESLPDLSSLAVPLRPDEVIRVAVLGTIVPIKGSERILDCARDARRRGLPLEFRILGSTDRDEEFAQLRNVHVSGAYRECEVFHRLRNERCHLAFLPSLWPETFMYTLSIAMAARLFIVSFDLGAQAERLRSWRWCKLLPLESGPERINDAFLSAARIISSGSIPPTPAPSATYPELLTSYYDFTERERDHFRGSLPRDGSRARSNLQSELIFVAQG